MKGCELLHAAHTQETHKHAGNLLKSASGVFVSGSNETVVITRSASSYQMLNIWETLSVIFDCEWAPSIDVTNSPNRSEHAARLSINSLIRGAVVRTGLWSHAVFASLSLILSISCSYEPTLTRHGSYSDSLFLPGAIQLVRSAGREAARGPSRSESPAALHPKHRLSSPMMMTIFLP